MIKIVDNFYKNPNSIRKMALESKYELISSGNYIGRDTLNKGIMFPELNENIKKIFPDPHHKVVCSRFRSAVKGDTHLTFVHADSYAQNSGWHIIVYLTKGIVEDGLTLYNHVNYGEVCTSWTREHNMDTENFEKFIPTKTIKYKYNRALIIDYSYFHSSMHHTGIGNRLDNSRLMHIIEICDDRTAHYNYRTSLPGTCMAGHKDPCSWNENNHSFLSSEPDSSSDKRMKKFINEFGVE